MAKPSLDELQQLIDGIVFPFYRIKRQIPLRFDADRWENDAEHSWSLALIACALAPHIDGTLDTGKIAQLAIVHDLVEVHAGDTSNFAADADIASKDEREKQAFGRLKQELQAFPWIVDTIEQYETQDSEEARFVKSVDKLIPMLIDYMEEGQLYKEEHITVDIWKSKLSVPRRKAQAHSGAFEYYQEIWDALLAHPEYFHTSQPIDK